MWHIQSSSYRQLKKKVLLMEDPCETPAVNSNDGWLTFARTAIVISFLRTIIQNIALR